MKATFRAAEAHLSFVIAFFCLAGTRSLSSAGNVSWMVTNLNENGPGSLRQTIATARSGDMISFAVTGAITLTNGELIITKDLRIGGPGQTNLTISGNNQSRVFYIDRKAEVLISGLTIINGCAQPGASGTSNTRAGGDGWDGGGIYNQGILDLRQCTISNCAAGNGGSGYLPWGAGTADATNWVAGIGGSGGAVYNTGRLLLVGCLLVSNSSGNGGSGGGAGPFGASGSPAGNGGAIYNGGSLTLRDCVLDNNSTGNGGGGYILGWGSSEGGQSSGAGGSGGGLYDAGKTMTKIGGCQFRFNRSGAGGWRMSSPFAQVAVGVSGGAGGGGGALWAAGAVRINDSTFISNEAGPGGPGSAWGSTGQGGAGGVGGAGGAIYTLGALSLTGCSCASNHAGTGGGGGSSYAGFPPRTE